MADITLLDGSIGQELVRRSGDDPTPLWSTRVMQEYPDLVGDLHRDYFAAGARVATTNTYAVHRSRLERVGLADDLPALIETALTQAETARAEGGGRIAGALGPLLASYRPDLDPDPVEAAAKFGELVALMRDRVDILLAETVSSLTEAEGILRATDPVETPVWLAFTVRDDDGTMLRSGEALADAREVVDAHRVDAVLINCSRPEAIPAALEIIGEFGKPFGAFANGFEEITDAFLQDAPTVDALRRRVDLGPAAYADHVMIWVANGATIVGGCCEVGPDHIAELARRLRAAGHTIT